MLKIVIAVKMVVKFIFCVLQSEEVFSAETSISEEDCSYDINLAQKEDGGTVVTVMESIEDSSFGTSDVNLSHLMGRSINWCGVVNGTRYVGHLRSGRSSGPKLKNNDAVIAFPRETKKERNRRLLIRDQVIQARKVKIRRSRRMRKVQRKWGGFR